ncbi:MAG: recombinase family protein [Acidobacteriota bacterium]|nr:recombinase family protein [Acidobacteriota bacterium]
MNIDGLRIATEIQRVVPEAVNVTGLIGAEDCQNFIADLMAICLHIEEIGARQPLRQSSTHDQQTLPLQLESMRSYAAQRGWIVVLETQEIGSGSIHRPKRELLMKAARRREIDIILV